MAAVDADYVVVRAVRTEGRLGVRAGVEEEVVNLGIVSRDVIDTGAIAVMEAGPAGVRGAEGRGCRFHTPASRLVRLNLALARRLQGARSAIVSKVPVERGLMPRGGRASRLLFVLRLLARRDKGDGGGDGRRAADAPSQAPANPAGGRAPRRRRGQPSVLGLRGAPDAPRLQVLVASGLGRRDPV
eukprot:693273-Alexandrium_andersonii.AAC.1